MGTLIILEGGDGSGKATDVYKRQVLIGSIISAIIGYTYLRIVGAKRKECHIGLYHNC